MSEPFTHFSQDNLQLLRQAIELALSTVADEFGLDMRVGTMSFNAATCSIKLEATVSNLAGEVETLEKLAFRHNAVLLGLEPDDLGRTFLFDGHQYRIEGINPRATKMPINAVQICTGENYKFSADAVRTRVNRDDDNAQPV